MTSVAGRRIALIGGAGFIGHNLALRLKRLGAEPFVVDSLAVNNYYSIKARGRRHPERLPLFEDHRTAARLAAAERNPAGRGRFPRLSPLVGRDGAVRPRSGHPLGRRRACGQIEQGPLFHLRPQPADPRELARCVALAAAEREAFRLFLLEHGLRQLHRGDRDGGDAVRAAGDLRRLEVRRRENGHRL